MNALYVYIMIVFILHNLIGIGESHLLKNSKIANKNHRRQAGITGNFGLATSVSFPTVNQRFVTTTFATTKRRRTTPLRMSFTEDCDYLAQYCLKAYDTGKLCGRTLYYKYQNFKNYCMLDYVNCMERYEVWQVVHMGDCFTVEPLTSFENYPYQDDYFLDEYYLLEK